MLKKIIYILVFVLLAACGQTESDPTAMPEIVATDAPTLEAETAEPVPESESEAAADPTAETGSAAQSNLLAPQGTPRETYNAPFPVAITLDGDTSDWQGVPRVVVPESALVVTGATSVSFAAAADEEYLYLLGDVTDARIISGEHGTDYWNEDSVEFYLNGSGDLGATSYKDGVLQLTIPPFNIGRPPEEVVIGGISNEMADAQVVVVESDDGYIVEIAVPLQNRAWNIQREHGSVIGFQVHLNGATESARNLKAIWSVFDTSDSSYQNPSVFGQLVFFEIGQGDVVANVPEPTPAPTREPIEGNPAYRDATLSVEERVEDLMSRMSLEDKVAQMTLVEKNSINPADISFYGIGGLLSGGGGYPAGSNSPEGWAEMVDGFQAAALDAYLGIPLIYGVDAVHGHNNVNGAVIFPHNIGLGAANNPDLMVEIGRVTALEMIATGIYWNYAPVVAVPQDIRWGRTYEAYGENTDLVTNLATAFMQGLQGDDLSAPDTVLATAKHYVADGGTAWGSSTTGSYQIDQGVTDIDEETLRAVHLPPYAALIDGGAQNVMISYSSWDGIKMHGQAYLISDVLLGELGFEGFIVSDWGGIDQITNDYYTAVVAAINAGVDMNMVPYDYKRFMNTTLEAVEAGDVTEERIDQAVRNILTVKFELGLFEHPFSNPDLLAQVGSDEHRAVARQAVAESQVLLKNEGDVLPLAADVPLVLVGGAAADDIGIQSGGWTIEWQGREGDITPGTTILEAIEATVSADTTVFYNEFGRYDDFELPENTPRSCIAVVGERPYAEGLGDSPDLRLPVNDLRAVARMEEVCDTLVVVLISGRPLIITDLMEDWDALVAAWLPGTEGMGVADVLFGLQPFAGTLPYTWPASADQLPFDFTAEINPLFPFGYGLQTAE